MRTFHQLIAWRSPHMKLSPWLYINLQSHTCAGTYYWNVKLHTHTHTVFITATRVFIYICFFSCFLADLYFMIQWPTHLLRIIKWLRALLLLIIANLKIISNSIRLTCVIYYAVLFPIKNSGWIVMDAEVPPCVHVSTRARWEQTASVISAIQGSHWRMKLLSCCG